MLRGTGGLTLMNLPISLQAVLYGGLASESASIFKDIKIFLVRYSSRNIQI